MMGVAGDEDMPVSPGPVAQDLFRLLFPGVIFGGAGGVGDSQFFQGPPYISHQKAGQPPESTVKQVRLMSVGQVDIFLAERVPEDDAGVKGDMREQRAFTHLFIAKVGVEIFLQISGIFLDHIVIAVDGIHPTINIVV